MSFDNNIASYLSQGIQQKDPKLYDLLTRLIAAVTELYDASSINTGTLSDDRLSENIPTVQYGDWIPIDVSGAALTFTGVTGEYVRLGKLIISFFSLTYPVTASGANSLVGGLPFTSENTGNIFGGYISGTTLALNVVAFQLSNSKTFRFQNNAAAIYTNANLSAKIMNGAVIYRVP